VADISEALAPARSSVESTRAPGTFAGKSVFASTTSRVFYLTQKDIKSNGSLLRVPAMASSAATDGERCILYAQADGSMRVQMPSLLWISLLSELGLLILDESLAKAATLRFSGDPSGQIWEVSTAGGWQRVYYSVDQASPILSVHGGAGTPGTFGVSTITPSLAAIRAAKKARQADLRLVDLSGETLDGIDFSEADFSFGRLEGCHFVGSILTSAKFISANLAGVGCNGSTLDRADMTQAVLDGATWGTPKSAVGIVLTACFARKAVLGGQATPLDCTGASLASGDFRGANLNGLILVDARLGGAILAGCTLDKAKLDRAKMADAIAVGASFTGASMRGIDAQGASFVRAILTSADLTRARMGARAWLFALASTYAKDLDEKQYVQPALIDAFRKQGIELQPSDAVTVIEEGRRWSIADPKGPYALALNMSDQIDIFLANPDLRPATLRGAICRGTTAPGVSLAGADLRGVQWYSKPATLDHADLEGATLSGSLLVQTDFTQAYMAGADLSQCVLVQAGFRGCRLGAGDSRRAFSLEGSVLTEANFDEATLLAALLTDSLVALPRGVPLLRLPKSLEQYFVQGDLVKLAPEFKKAGYPLGTNPVFSQSLAWLIDNRNDSAPGAPSWYRIRSVRGNLQVYDATSGKSLFSLDASYEQYLSRPTAAPDLVAAFGRAGYSLVAGAPIVLEQYWQIDVGTDALGQTPVSWPALRTYAEADYLPVYASVRLLLRDWTAYPAGLAFSATAGLEKALNPLSLGPSGYPRSWVEAKLLDWEQLVTASPR
jgi:uncharacterized protein YjbI with pentapeptide repeats